MGIDIAKATGNAKFVDAAEYLSRTRTEPLPAPAPPPAPVAVLLPGSKAGAAAKSVPEPSYWMVAGVSGLAVFAVATMMLIASKLPSDGTPAVVRNEPRAEELAPGFVAAQIRAERIASNLEIETGRASALVATLEGDAARNAAVRFESLATDVRTNLDGRHLDAATRGIAAFRTAIAEVEAPVLLLPAVAQAPAPVTLPAQAPSSSGYFYDKARVDALSAELKVETDRAAIVVAAMDGEQGRDSASRFAKLAQDVRENVVANRLDAAARDIRDLRKAIATHNQDAVAGAGTAVRTSPTTEYRYDRERVAMLGTSLKAEMRAAFAAATSMADGPQEYARVETLATGVRKSIVENSLDDAAAKIAALHVEVARMTEAPKLPSVRVDTQMSSVSPLLRKVALSPHDATELTTSIVEARLARAASVPFGEYGNAEAAASEASYRNYLKSRIELFAGVPSGPGEVAGGVSGAPANGLPAETLEGMNVKLNRMNLFYGAGPLPAAGEVVAVKNPGSAVFEWVGGRKPDIRIDRDGKFDQTMLLPGDPEWRGVTYTVKGF
jgi:hypothetical protein